MSNKDYKEIAQQYQELSVVYQHAYEDVIEQMGVVSALQGVWAEIKSDCIKYTLKTKKSPQQAENRLTVINEAIKQFDYLLNEKERQNEMIRILTKKYTEVFNENKELKKQIEINEKLWQEES